MAKQLEPRELNMRIDRGDMAPLYLLIGEEIFMIDQAIGKIKNKALGDGLADFNLNTFYASDCKVQDVVDAAQTLPMMAQRRVVLVKQAHDFSAVELEQLTPLIENPVDTSVLVLVAEKADMRKRFFKTFESKGVVCKFVRPYENQLDPWIHEIAKLHGKVLSLDAVVVIKEWVGTSLTDINNELAKVAQYVGERAHIDVGDVKAVVSRSRIDTVFELVNCMGRGDCASSFTHLANLLDNGQNEIGVLSMTIRHFRILLLCHEALKEGLSQPQIASRVGVLGFFIKEYIEQAKRHDMRQLLQIYDVLLDTDRALKSNPLSNHLWLENLVLQACRYPGSGQSQISAGF